MNVGEFLCGMTERERERENEENFLSFNLLSLKFFLLKKNSLKVNLRGNEQGKLAATNYNFVALITRWK